MNLLGRHIQNEVPWYILFTGDIALVDGARKGISSKLERCSHVDNI